jgi:hypothetical protein
MYQNLSKDAFFIRTMAYLKIFVKDPFTRPIGMEILDRKELIDIPYETASNLKLLQRKKMLLIFLF